MTVEPLRSWRTEEGYKVILSRRMIQGRWRYYCELTHQIPSEGDPMYGQSLASGYGHTPDEAQDAMTESYGRPIIPLVVPPR